MTGADQRRPELLGRLLPQQPPRGSTVDADVARVWAGVVGADVARNARPLSLRRGRLVVATSSSSWAQTLQALSSRMIEGLNEELGGRVVEAMVFRHAGWVPGPDLEEVPALSSVRRRILSVDEEAAIAEVAALAGNEELGRRVAAAMRADLEGRPA